MITNILDILQFAREENWRGEYIDVALGKNKYPKGIVEAYKQYKNGLWEK